MRIALRPLGIVFLALALITLGDHAQTSSAPGKPLSPELARRVELALRSHADIPPDADLVISPRTPSELPGYDLITITVKVANGNTSAPLKFLISADEKTFAQFNKYDISKDPRALVSATDRPARGGPENAPVLIVGFDDLECPFCAQLHRSLFPVITQRYGDQVHIVYRDFPLPFHPWAMHAAVDVNCLGAQSPAGYWNLVDYIHAHFDKIGVDPSAPATTLGDALNNKDTKSSAPNDDLDRLTREEAGRQHIDLARLDACIARQDTSAMDASVKLGEGLGVGGTPALFINGEMIVGAQPLEIIFKVIDNALRVAGKTPPPAYVPPPAPPGLAAKPGN